MCHSEVPFDQAVPGSTARPIAITLASGEAMPATLTGTAGPPVLLIADMFGASPFYEMLAARLARAGFDTLLVDYFFRLPALTEHTHEAGFARRRNLDEVRTLEDLQAALAFLRTRPGYQGSVGTIGFCMGGTFALDLAARETDLVTVAYYGFPVPQASLAFPPPAPLDLAEQIRGPILACWGDQDETVGLANVERFVEAMAAAPADFTHRVYPGLPHGFLGQARFDDESDAAGRSWALAVEHLRRHL